LNLRDALVFQRFLDSGVHDELCQVLGGLGQTLNRVANGPMIVKLDCFAQVRRCGCDFSALVRWKFWGQPPNSSQRFSLSKRWHLEQYYAALCHSERLSVLQTAGVLCLEWLGWFVPVFLITSLNVAFAASTSFSTMKTIVATSNC
jgi:hypothetical protein